MSWTIIFARRWGSIKIDYSKTMLNNVFMFGDDLFQHIKIASRLCTCVNNWRGNYEDECNVMLNSGSRHIILSCYSLDYGHFVCSVELPDWLENRRPWSLQTDAILGSSLVHVTMSNLTTFFLCFAKKTGPTLKTGRFHQYQHSTHTFCQQHGFCMGKKTLLLYKP